MILFVFEGKKRETDIFKTLEYLYFQKGQAIVCSFGKNIYELYRQLIELEEAGGNAKCSEGELLMQQTIRDASRQEIHLSKRRI